jgi:hypothetical protein
MLSWLSQARSSIARRLPIGIDPNPSKSNTHESTEWDADLLFKTQWTISRKAEFMVVGVCPEWVHFRQNGKVTNSISGEIAGDLMFWGTGENEGGLSCSARSC